MRYLLDTHTFIWAYGQSTKLSGTARSAIEDTRSEVFVSAVSFWEIAIKIRAKRLHIGGKSAADLISEARTMDFHIIDLHADEAATQGKLTEETHFDPFDRMLIWQAISRKLTLISSDAQFKRFIPDGLKLIW
jgi:PIN domain nuclease of toxin-antitoxin system